MKDYAVIELSNNTKYAIIDEYYYKSDTFLVLLPLSESEDEVINTYEIYKYSSEENKILPCTENYEEIDNIFKQRLLESEVND